MGRQKVIVPCATFLIMGLALGFYLSNKDASNSRQVQAAGGRVENPTQAAPNRYAYYPGTEQLQPIEIRVVACGTGMPSARRSQAATCFLVELGDGQKFLFDIGSGSHANLQSLMIPSNYLTKIFITHLHTDHWGDLASL
ncbi:MAG: MBL fold metallo-hydrolase, partial [Planctomycetales bacterium]